MPRRNDLKVERLAERIVRHEEEAAGRRVRKLSKVDERRFGGDFVSTDGAGVDHLVEIKGWGEPLRVAPSGAFRYSAELRTARWKASLNPFWRLEIVANLTAAFQGRGLPERLTLTGSDLERRTFPMLWEVSLDGLEDRIRQGPALALEGMDEDGGDAGFWAGMLEGIDDEADNQRIRREMREQRASPQPEADET